jgi:hypothetical protein
MAALKVCSHELDSLTGDSYEECRRVRRNYYELARSILAEVIRTRAPESSLDQHVAIMALFGTLNWLYRWYHPERDRSPASLASQITAQFLHGVLGSGARPEDGEKPPPTHRRRSARR